MPSWTQVSKLGEQGEGDVSCSQAEGRETQGDVRDLFNGGKETEGVPVERPEYSLQMEGGSGALGV